QEPRTATAEERAVIWGLTHKQYKRLGLHLSGCAEKTAAERRRITLDNQNVRKRMHRAADKVRVIMHNIIDTRFRAALLRVRLSHGDSKASSLSRGLCTSVESKLETSIKPGIQDSGFRLDDKAIKPRPGDSLLAALKRLESGIRAQDHRLVRPIDYGN